MIKLREGVPSKDGDCSFCSFTNHYSTVFVVTTTDGNRDTAVRFCLPCFASMCAQITPAKKEAVSVSPAAEDSNADSAQTRAWNGRE